MDEICKQRYKRRTNNTVNNIQLIQKGKRNSQEYLQITSQNKQKLLKHLNKYHFYLHKM